jgi:hypothetical protein
MNILNAIKRLISHLKKESQVENIKEDISKLSTQEIVDLIGWTLDLYDSPAKRQKSFLDNRAKKISIMLNLKDDLDEFMKNNKISDKERLKHIEEKRKNDKRRKDNKN